MLCNLSPRKQSPRPTINTACTTEHLTHHSLADAHASNHDCVIPWPWLLLPLLLPTPPRGVPAVLLLPAPVAAGVPASTLQPLLPSLSHPPLSTLRLLALAGLLRHALLLLVNCRPMSCAYMPFAAISCSWLPCSATCPWLTTNIRWASLMVDKRCATTTTVRPAMRRFRASCTTACKTQMQALQ
jgi:hypothetical protein